MEIVIIDKAFQIKKCEILNIFVKHLCILKKFTLMNNYKQLSLTVILKKIFEFAEAAKLLLIH